jgi:hypothetical protein
MGLSAQREGSKGKENMEAVHNTTRRPFSTAILVATLSVIGILGLGCAGSIPNLVVNPSAVNFGSLKVGASAPVTVTVSNRGPFAITIAQVSASLAQVSVSGMSLPATLLPGQGTHITVVFSPNAAQNYSGMLRFSESSGQSVLARLIGTGVREEPSGSSPLSVSASSVAFGSTPTGNAATQTVTVSNTGSSNITIAGLTLSGAGFSANGIPSGTMLAPGQSTVLTVVFDPAAAGSVSGSIIINTDVAGSPVISLSGAGSNSVATSVTLHWQPSASPSVAGYNVYRSTTPGNELDTSPINPTLVMGDSYTDTNIANGAVYYYQVVAVNLSDIQSEGSNEASAAVP